MDTPLKITTDGKSLIISPAADPEREARFEQALKRVNEKHGETLRPLPDELADENAVLRRYLQQPSLFVHPSPQPS